MNIIRKMKFILALGVINFIPFTRFFEMKLYLLRSAGIKCGKGVKVAGKIHISTGNLEIGENTWIGNNAAFYNSDDSRIVVGTNVDIAPNVVVITGTHVMGTSERRAGPGLTKDVYIGNGTWIGVNVTILPGVHIGSGNMIAAGAVVTSNSEDNVLVGGVPGKVIRALND